MAEDQLNAHVCIFEVGRCDGSQILSDKLFKSFLGGGTSTVFFLGRIRWLFTRWASSSARSFSFSSSYSFLSSTSVSGGAAEVDEAEHCEVQPALLLHVHEDRQLSSEEEVSRSPGDILIKLVVLYSQTQHLVDAGLMRDDELKVLQDLDTKVFQRSPHKSRIFPIKIIPFFQRPHNKI